MGKKADKSFILRQLGEKSPKRQKKISPQRRCLRRQIGNIEKINKHSVIPATCPAEALAKGEGGNPV